MEPLSLVNLRLNELNEQEQSSSLSLSNPQRIDERFITAANHINVTEIVDNDQLIHDYKWIKFQKESSLRRFYRQANSQVIIERETIPGTITPLLFAKQLRDSQFEKSFREVKATGTTYLYTSTVGSKLSDWSTWIYAIREESYTDLYNQHEHSSDHWINLSLRESKISREHTPDDQRSFIDNNQTDPVQIKYTPEIDEPNNHETRIDNPNYVYTFQDKEHSDDEQSSGSLFIDSRLPSPTQPNHGISDNYDTPGSILVHSRARNISLARIHDAVKLPVVFTDLYLNLLNKLHNEYHSLLKTFNSIVKFDRFNDDDNLRVFKMLMLYARSMQPPFRFSMREPDTPVLHLELFFDPLISESRIIHEVRFDLKHYREDTLLNADRYSAFINNVLNVRLKLFSIQGIKLTDT